MRPAHVLGQLWMAPMTAFGLCQTLLGASFHSRTREGVLNFVVRPRTFLHWYMRTIGIAAYTLGAVVTYADPAGPGQPRLYRHEYEHVLQTMALGPLMPIAYAGSSLWQLVRGRRIYRDNWFEVRARAAETKPLPGVPPAGR
ncbi:MAG: hypothetical protein IRZ16_15565 [Myxococcaceae bacterium]|nr:hypothetical protein [Myxococcaceae bacterium]